MAVNNTTSVDERKCIIAIANKSCLACENYKSVHPRTKVCYCKDGSKTVFKDSGCDSWKIAESMKGLNLIKWISNELC